MEILKEIPIEKLNYEILAYPSYFKANDAIEYGYFVENNLILPFYIKKKACFKYLIFTTKIIGVYNLIKEKEFLNNIIKYLKHNKIVDFVLCNHVTALFNIYPNGAKVCKFGSYILDLSIEEEELFKKLHTKHRNVIKKSQKNGVTIKCNISNFNNCVSIIQQTLQRQGLGSPSTKYFETLRDSLNNNVEFYLAEKDNEVQGVAIILWDKNSAYYLYGGTIEHPYTGSMNLLQWEVIKNMKNRGVRKYDFVGARIAPEPNSKYEGIQRFKKRFGGDLKEGFLWKYSIVKYKYLFYNLLIWIKSIKNFNIYKGDLIDQENKRIGL